MSDTQAETEALLPWTEQHLKSALINLIEAAKNSVRGPERGGSESAVSGIYQQIVAAWNTRAQPKPAPEVEALFRDLEQCVNDSGDDTGEGMAARNAGWRAIEALRRRIAELRATSLKYQLAFGDRDNDAHRLADRVAELEAALAACRQAVAEAEKMFRWYGDLHAAKEQTPENADKTKRNYDMADQMARALKTKEPTNG